MKTILDHVDRKVLLALRNYIEAEQVLTSALETADVAAINAARDSVELEQIPVDFTHSLHG